MPLLSLGSAMGSRAICGSPSNRKGVVSCSSVLSANTKQAPPESVYWHVNIWQARAQSLGRLIGISLILNSTECETRPVSWFS